MAKSAKASARKLADEVLGHVPALPNDRDELLRIWSTVGDLIELLTIIAVTINDEQPPVSIAEATRMLSRVDLAERYLSVRERASYRVQIEELTGRRKVFGWNCDFSLRRYPASMKRMRDHHSPKLFDPWEHLGPKRRRLLERSWAGVFREYLLVHLPVTELAAGFCDGRGRPSKDLSVALGALMLQQLHDLTDQQTTEAVALNIAWHYALDIRHEPDAYLCERTLRN